MYDVKETLEYAHLFCAEDELGVLPPEEEPLYDADTDAWDLWFKVDEEDCVVIPLGTEAEGHSVIEEINKQRVSQKESLTTQKESA